MSPPSKPFLLARLAAGRRGPAANGRQEEGAEKKLSRKSLITADELSFAAKKMEGNGSNFGPFLSSRTRPGRAFWKLWGARRDENGASRRKCLGGGRLAGKPASRQKTPQRFENVHFAPGNGMAHAALDPQCWARATKRSVFCDWQGSSGCSMRPDSTEVSICRAT